jgi:hypothetical protein
MSKLSIDERYNLADEIARKWANRADISEVISYYYNAQFEFLNDLPDDELLEIVEEEKEA